MDSLSDRKSFHLDQSTRMRYAIFLLVAIGLLAQAASADDDWKLLVRVKGKVETREAEATTWRPVFSSRMLKNENDRVRTLAESVGQLRSPDGTAITVGPDSEVIVGEYNPEAGRINLRVQELGSSLRAKVGKYFGGDRVFEVETPNSVLSARGTEFIVVFDDRIDPRTGDKTRVTTLDVLEGTVVGRHGNEAIAVPAGFRYSTDGNGYSLHHTPPDFLGVPQPLIPITSGSIAVIERGTMSSGLGGGGAAGSSQALSSGGAYLNPLLPAFQGAATAPIQINLTILVP
jgi:hypothetical protein